MAKRTRVDSRPVSVQRLEDSLGRPLRPGPISRRKFVKTSGGILVAAGLGSACGSDFTGSTSKGSLRAVVTGLDPSATTGGQVTVTALDVTGFAPLTVNLPASGDSGNVPNIPAGNYRIAYAPPTNHALVTGQVNPQDVVVSVGVETTVAWSVIVSQSNVSVTVIGLQAGVSAGGSASILRTDIAGQSPVILNIPSNGTGVLGVAAGTYSVSYTPPGGYAVVSGVANPVTNVVATAGGTATVTFTVLAVPTSGALQVNVTGLTGSPPDGGSAVAQRTDAPGSPITINISAAGIGTNSSVPAGTYTVTYSPPSGFSLAGNAVNPVNGVVVGAGATASVSFAVFAGDYATPDQVNNASFETGWDGFTDWSGQTPSGDHLSRATDFAYAGAYSVRREWFANNLTDTGAQFSNVLYPNQFDRLWVRLYIRLTNQITTYWKFSRWYNQGFTNNLGGLYLAQGSDMFCWGGMPENGSILTTIGLTQAQLCDGRWHSLEYDYWRNGDPSGWPSAAFWFDNLPCALPDGTRVKYQGAGNSSYWAGGRLYAGVRANSYKLDTVEWLATLNANNQTSGQVNVDRMAISSLGRIGP